MLISGIQPFTILDFPGKIACIMFVPGCNFRCGYCHNPEFVVPERVQAMKGGFITEEAFFSFLDKRRGLLDGVVISGGEPTLAPELVRCAARIKDRGFSVKLDTNGNRPDVLKKLLEQKLLDYVAMDYKTSLVSYRALVGSGASATRIRETREILQTSGIEYEFRTTLIREIHTPEILSAMIQELRGARRVCLQQFRRAVTLDPGYAALHPFSSEEVKALAEQFRQTVEEVIIR